MSFHIKILIPRNKSSVEVHEFGRSFYAGKSILASLRYLIFKILGGMPLDPLEEFGPMAKIESALI